MAAKQQSELWKDATTRQSFESLNFELHKLLNTSTPQESVYWEKEFDGYKKLFERFLTAKPYINWENIQPLPTNAIKNYDSLPEPDPEVIQGLLNKLIVVKLNGGLGTSMGCKGPKSVIPVRHDLTFLDLTMQQIESLNRKYDVDVPLVLMNSFNTDEDTKKIVRKYKNVKVKVHTFNQSRYPRVNKETLMPIVHSLNTNNNEYWYPPGHGDFYQAFSNSGLLRKFIEQGKEYCFISNIDNLGALVDMNILNFMANSGTEYVMEVTDKTRADIKGGTLIHYENRLMLLEIAQVSKDHEDEFKSISKFKIFNTNNLWCNLNAVDMLVTTGQMEMEIIVNPKHLSDFSIDVIQLETAAGAAIKNFRGAVGVNVPRCRFLPVKKTQDLLLVMSNLYELEDGVLGISHKRTFESLPLIKLGGTFDKVQDFLRRFRGIPNILELDHLTVSGDVTFGKDVSLKGTVIIIANHGDRIDIPPGAVFENKIVSGNLRILDH
jgi:UTP--glucose-1-phosphate uridylyltransferase